MKIHVNAKGIKITEAIENYTMQKLEKAEKYFDHLVSGQVFFSIEKRSQKAEIVIHGARQTFRAMASAADLYSAIDLASDKIDSQIKKYKERLRSHHKTPEPAAAPVEESSAPVAVQVPVVKTAVACISAQEAAARMDENGQHFMVFEDKGSGQLHVIYRREDDSYCILQPVRKR